MERSAAPGWLEGDEELEVGAPRHFDGDPAAALRRLLAPDPDGMRSCVPVFGSGLNLQAAAMEDYQQRDDWGALLAKIATAMGMSSTELDQLPKTPLALWEALLTRWAEANDLYAFEAEGALQKLVCEELRLQERECEGFRLYRAIANARFRDVISLNFDRRIANGAKKHRFSTGPKPAPRGSHGESLFRHSVIHYADGQTGRVWYPHGDTKKVATIKLGVRKYGFHVALLKEQLEDLGSEWRFKPNATQVSRGSFALDEWDRADPTWLEPFLARPLLFVGCQLSAEEWGMWWALVIRSRRRIREPAYYLTFGPRRRPIPPHFDLARGLEVMTFAQPGDLWEALFDALEAHR